MRILFVTAHKHLPELRGGMEVNTHELALRLRKKGIAVGVLCSLAGKGMTGFGARLRMKLLGDECPVDHGLGYPVWRPWNSAPHVQHVSEVFRPDVIVLQGGAGFDALLTSSLHAQVPVYCYLHTQDRLPLDVGLLSNPRLRFISNSEFTSSIHPEKTFAGVVRPLIAPELYATKTDRSSVVFVNPAPHKGLDVATALASARPDVPFLFVVNHRGAQARLAEDLKLSSHPNIRLVGPLSDMREVYMQAKLVLAPSQCFETWGRVATEAHASGIPVLASDRGGLPEAVGPGGICLSSDAPFSEWLGTFDRMWNDPACYAELSEKARAYGQRADIAPEQIVTRFVELLSRP